MKKYLTLSLFVILCQIFSPGAFAQYNKMMIGDNNNGQIVTANLDGSHIDTLNLGGNYQSFYDADVDPVHQRIYLAWYYGIYSMNYDGSNFDTIVNYPAGGYSSGIAVDPVNGYIYWGSTNEGIIYRANLDGSNQTPFLTGLGYLSDVDIDIVNGRLFYGQYITGTKGLFSVDLNGDNNGPLVTGYDVAYIGLDIKNQRVYFCDGSTCHRADYNYNSSNDTILYTNLQPGGFFVDTNNATLYVADETHNLVFRSDLNGANVDTLISNNQLAAPFGPLLYDTTNTTGIKPIVTQNVFKVYPNPTADRIHVQVDAAMVGDIYSVTDQLGKTVMTGKLNAENSTIEISNLSGGIYLFSFGDMRQTVTVVKN